MIEQLNIFSPIQTIPLILLGIFISIISIATWWDIRTFNKKNGYIPGYLTTLALIVAIIFAGVDGIFVGILAFAVGYMFFELDLYRGEADLKLFTAICLILGLAGSIVFVFVLGLATWVTNYYLGKKGLKEVPYIPILVFAFIVTYVAGLLI